MVVRAFRRPALPRCAGWRARRWERRGGRDERAADNLRTDDQIVGYYAQAVEAIGRDVPFVIQDYPLLLTVVMTANVIRRIVMDNPSCVMLKAEDWPGLEKISALRGMQKDGSLRELSIMVANGGPVP